MVVIKIQRGALKWEKLELLLHAPTVISLPVELQTQCACQSSFKLLSAEICVNKLQLLSLNFLNYRVNCLKKWVCFITRSSIIWKESLVTSPISTSWLSGCQNLYVNLWNVNRSYNMCRVILIMPHNFFFLRRVFVLLQSNEREEGCLVSPKIIGTSAILCFRVQWGAPTHEEKRLQFWSLRWNSPHFGESHCLYYINDFEINLLQGLTQLTNKHSSRFGINMETASISWRCL